MKPFSQQDLDAIDQLWRSVPADHVWTGWSAAGAEPDEVWLYRTRAHWRKFPLRKNADGFALYDEWDHKVAEAASLDGLLKAVESIPGLNESQNGESGA
ncbi:hypothetical protein [Henriciella aquimarina]|uniref:hypothetical protein n=1 Tax=Henriciella aquimarina TaxID=545261 RepID=UPI0009FE87EE|nr:hypothetical protein [Henriciella aquimarina]